jgi:hypothetical protein
MKSQKNIPINMLLSIKNLKKELHYFDKIEFKKNLSITLKTNVVLEKKQKIKI